MKDGDNNIRYQDGTGPDMVKASDYDQLKAENEQLHHAYLLSQATLLSLQEQDTALRTQLDEARELLTKTIEWNWAENAAPFYGDIVAWLDKQAIAEWLEACDGVDDFMQVWPEGTKE